MSTPNPTPDAARDAGQEVGQWVIAQLEKHGPLREYQLLRAVHEMSMTNERFGKFTMGILRYLWAESGGEAGTGGKLWRVLAGWHMGAGEDSYLYGIEGVHAKPVEVRDAGRTPLTDALQHAFNEDDSANHLAAYCEMVHHARAMEAQRNDLLGAMKETLEAIALVAPDAPEPVNGSVIHKARTAIAKAEVQP